MLLGVVVGVLVSLLGSGDRRAEASVLVSSPAGTQAVRPMLPNLRELATGGVVAGNVRSTLRLAESTEKLRSRLHANVRPQSEVIAISATDPNADHARQLAQEAAVVFAQLVDARFGTGKPELHAAVLDSAHVEGGPDRHFLRNGAIGALVGLLLGAAAMFVLASRAPLVYAAGGDPDSSATVTSASARSVLEKRVQGVTARERALAERPGTLAVRERELDERDERLEASERDLAARAASDRGPRAGAGGAGGGGPAGARACRCGTGRSGRAAVRVGSWNVNDLQRTVDAQTGAPPEQVEEWRSYLFFLREHTASDGSLPPQFDGLVEDVFGAIVLRDVSR